MKIPWNKIEKTDSCWNWIGYINPKGYGKYYLAVKSKSVPAHRYIYEFLVGEITKGLTLDHLCRNRRCVNPTHLEAVTIKENVLRGIGISAQNIRKTHCKRGHEFTKENTRLRINKSGENGRICLTCKRALDIIKNRKWRELQKLKKSLNPL